MNTKRLIQLAALFAALFFVNACKKEPKLWIPSPPYPGLEIKLSSYTINAGKDTVLVLSNGTAISIPAGALLTAEGKVVTGTYELLYRELHDAVDIFLAGIPMEFNSIGQNRVLRTAGMFELDAEQDGVNLRIADDKRINIRFASRYPGSDYSFFYLNPQKGAWEWVDIPEIEINQQKVDAIKVLSAKFPEIFLGDKFFVINFDRFLDIYLNNDYEKIFNARKNDKAFKHKLEEYGFKLYNADIEGELVFLKSYYHPAEMLWKDIDGKVFPKWINDFKYDWVKDSQGQWTRANYSFISLGNNQYSVSYKNGKENFSKRMEAIMPLAHILKYPARKWQQQYDEAIETLKVEQEKIDLMAETYRTFSINRLGTYNFDCLLKGLDEWTKVNASFTLSEKLAEGNVIIILGDNSGYLTVKPEGFGSMRINPSSGHRILMILPDQQLGLFPISNQNAISIDSLKAATNPALTFKLEAKKITEAGAFREMLGFKK